MSLYKEFFKYVIPSMFAFALSGLYGIVDGFFLGNEMGDPALAAINIAYPITAFLQALGTGVGMGGAVQYTILKAQGKGEEKARCLGLTLLILGFMGVVLTPVLISGNKFLLGLLGAKGNLMTLGSEYISWIALGTIFQILGTGLVPFMRNIGGSMVSMIAMVAGSLMNIIFDYLLIWVYSYGMKGAALASVLGQVAAFTISIVYILIKKERIIWRGFSSNLLKKVLLTACSPFGLSFAPNITLILVNLNAVRYGGEFAVTVYAPVSYISYTVMLLLQGVSDGCQPLISRSYGKGEYERTRRIYHLSRNFSFLVGLFCFIFLYIQGREVVNLFGTSREVTDYVVAILPLLMSGMIFSGISRAVTSYFYATEKNTRAYFMIYSESVALLLLLLSIPVFMGIMGTWTSIVLSQLIMAVMGLVLVRVK